MNPGGRGCESTPAGALVEATGDPAADAALPMAAGTRTIGACDKEFVCRRFHPIEPAGRRDMDGKTKSDTQGLPWWVVVCRRGVVSDKRPMNGYYPLPFCLPLADSARY